MIRGVHAMFYSSQPEALRAFLRDVLGFPFTDVGDGWLIFDMPEAEMGCHPEDAPNGAVSGTHDISFYCDDVQKTVAELTARGVEFTTPIADHGYGLVTHFKVPGGFAVQLYQPRYVKTARPARKPAAAAKAKRPAKAARGAKRAARAAKAAGETRARRAKPRKPRR
jgi:predicted enzyme related to lactoylglutathione lyase